MFEYGPIGSRCRLHIPKAVTDRLSADCYGLTAARDARTFDKQMPGDCSHQTGAIRDIGRDAHFFQSEAVHAATVGTADCPINGDHKRAKNAIETIITQLQPYLRSMGDADMLDMHTKRTGADHGARRGHQMFHPLQTATNAS
ncbi:hypothetical protein D3C72_1852000 [compost metagenome]